jgi:hypothetical protein
MSDLSRLNTAIELIAGLPLTNEYVEARRIGEHLISVIAEAEIRTANPRWEQYRDPPNAFDIESEAGTSWQHVGAVTGRIVASLKRIEDRGLQ